MKILGLIIAGVTLFLAAKDVFAVDYTFRVKVDRKGGDDVEFSPDPIAED